LVDEKFVTDLKKRVSEEMALKDHKSYYIGRVVIVSAQQIKDDTARKTAIKSAFDLKRAAEEKAKAPDTTRPGVVIPGPTPNVGLTRPDQLNLRPGARDDDPERKKQAELEPIPDPL